MPNQPQLVAQTTPNTKEEEATKMKAKCSSESSNWVFKPYSAFLAALHVLVLMFSMYGHPPFVHGAAGALP